MSYKQLTPIFLLLVCLQCSKSPSATPPVNPPAAADTTFKNPLLPSGPDPWVIQKDTLYYYTHTFGNKIAIFRTSKMSQLDKALITTIWSPVSGTSVLKDIWAPEIHFIQNKWYVYFAADTNGTNETHRLYVLENASPDPLTGAWEFKGKITDPSNQWAIDGSVFDYNGQLYFIWSGWEGDVDIQQNIYIAKMKNPWTIEGNRVLISAPTFEWEKNGAPPAVNEGPEIIKNSSGRVYLTFSASGCWTDSYSLGLLTLRDGGDPLSPADWTKTPTPVFTSKPANGAFGPGHNSFFKSRDGSETWILYHANPSANEGCGDERNPRMQKFTWNADGTPNFGEPVKINSPIPKPSGE